MNKEKEIRQLIVENVETRALEDGNLAIEGYVATFNSKSKYMGFYEIIDPRAFNGTLSDGHNIFMLYNHDWDKPLADTETNTLSLSVDNIGLRFSLTLDKTISYSMDAYNLVRKKLIKGCSFGFITNNETWSTNENFEDIRTLLDVTLLECTLTPIPAYNETSANVRSYKEYKDNKNRELNKEKEQRELDLLKIELDLLD